MGGPSSYDPVILIYSIQVKHSTTWFKITAIFQPVFQFPSTVTLAATLIHSTVTQWLHIFQNQVQPMKLNIILKAPVLSGQNQDLASVLNSKNMI